MPATLGDKTKTAEQHHKDVRRGNSEDIKNQLALTAERQKREGTDTAVVICDLHNLSAKKDFFSRSVRKEIIGILAERIAESIRNDDTVVLGKNEELVIICGGVHGSEGAAITGDRIHSLMDQPVSFHGCSALIHATVGISLLSQGEDPENCLKRAEKIMHQTNQMRTQENLNTAG